MHNKRSVILIMVSKLTEAVSSSSVQLKILHDTDKHPVHQSVRITLDSALISMPQEDESL